MSRLRHVVLVVVYIYCVFIISSKMIEKDVVVNKGFSKEYGDNLFVLNYSKDPYSKDIQANLIKDVKHYSERYRVDYRLVLAVIKTESNFHKHAMGRNKDGSYDQGYMQLNSRYYDGANNIDNGIAHLKWCLDNSIYLPTSLSYYNAGYGKVNGFRAGKTTFDYVGKVLKEYEYLKERLD